ncbi:MAG: stage III sporulation protein AE [Sarcina sp.]
MWNRIVRGLITIVILFSSTSCIAMSLENEVSKNFEETKIELESDQSIQRFYEYVNELNLESEFIEGMSIKEYIDQYMETGNTTLDFTSIVKLTIDYMFREFGQVLKLLLSVLVIALLSALLKNLQNSFSSGAISNVAFFACYALTIMLLTSSFLLGLNIAKDILRSLVDFMAVLMPVLVFLLSTSGGVVSAITIDPIVLLLVSLTPKIYIDIIFPLIFMYFALSFANNLTNEHKISNVCKFVKQIVTWSQGIVLTIFVGIIAIRGISANTIDAVTLKTAKFAVDNFVPIVGKAFSDAITTVAGYSLVLKSAVSTVGLLIIIALILYPIVKLIMMIFAYRITSAIIQPVADSRIVSAIDSVGDAMTMIFGSVVSISIMFFIIIAIMSSAGKFVVGG